MDHKVKGCKGFDKVLVVEGQQEVVEGNNERMGLRYIHPNSSKSDCDC
jgi:hypothetical protein